MKIFSKKTALTSLTLASLSLFNIAHAGLIVTQNDSASDLVSNIVGSGVSTSNIFNTGADNAFGTFSGGLSAGIAFDSGILLSTGNVNDAVGPNISTSTSTYFNGAGDANLGAIVAGTTYDAAVLTFDFISDGGDVFFNYVFASDEYNEYVNTSFNDVFAFYLDGVNIALIPGTSTAVAINSVNGGNPVGINAANSEFFNDNNNSTFDIEYDGFTDMFTANASGLTAGSHTLSIRIADTADAGLDSAVFIQSGSFSDTNPTNVPEPSTLLIFGLGLLGLASRKVYKA